MTELDSSLQEHSHAHSHLPSSHSKLEFNAEPTKGGPLNVAVIGSGIAGLTAAWILSQYKDHFNVTLFERNNYLGGHCRTLKVPPLIEFQANPNISPTPVDFGFVLCNPKSYPNFLNLLDYLKISLTPARTSFSVCKNAGQFEWATHHLGTLFAHTEAWFDFSSQGVWKMLYDITRFFHIANTIAQRTEEWIQHDTNDMDFTTNLTNPSILRDSGTLTSKFKQTGSNLNASNKHPMDNEAKYRSRLFYEKYAEMTVQEFLEEGNYSYAFRHYFLIPQMSSLWSTAPGNCIEGLPVLPLIRFLKNHDLLRFFGRTSWLTIPFGAATYVEKIAASIPHIKVGTTIKRVHRGTLEDQFHRNQVILTDDAKTKMYFDYVIMAVHADQVLPLVTEPTSEEQQVFQNVRFTRNRVSLHRDPRFMPKIRSIWASWNYTFQDDTDQDQLNLTYWMNPLQPSIPTHTHGELFLTFNPTMEPHSHLHTGYYAHPKYDIHLHRLQKQLPQLMHHKYTSYAGAWTRFGFHEDGVTSGILAAASLGASPPFVCHLHGRSMDQWPVLRALPLLPSVTEFGHRFQRSIPRRPTWVTLGWEKWETFWNPRPPWTLVGHLGMQHVPSIPPAYFTHPSSRTVRGWLWEWLEPLVLVLLFLCLGVPWLGYMFVTGQVDIEDGLETSHRKEILWLHPRLRIVWKQLKK
ncbi:hypothetical protein HMI55_006727 [Coelomomyces lativittatus]|nr:hypothetical protein HMI56_002985 [Coelomomyces lativittatus]KAJ1511085.1 hypothetical protein HMI55_006727 [Coelomomyces lativittatus]